MTLLYTTYAVKNSFACAFKDTNLRHRLSVRCKSCLLNTFYAFLKNLAPQNGFMSEQIQASFKYQDENFLISVAK